MMRVLTVDEAAKILGVEDLNAFCNITWLPEDHVGTFEIPKDSGAKVALARRIANMLLERGPVLLWITGWGVWPSSEHFDLFDRYRLSFGESRSLREAPVHFLDAGDNVTLISLLCIGFFFVWDFEILSLDREVDIVASHDEWLEARISQRELVFYEFFSKYIGLASNIDA